MYTGNTRCSNYFHVRWARTIVSLCIHFSVLLASPQKRAVILFCKCSISTPVFKESQCLVHLVSSGTSLLVALAPGEYSSKAESQKSTNVYTMTVPIQNNPHQQPTANHIWPLGPTVSCNLLRNHTPFFPLPYLFIDYLHLHSGTTFHSGTGDCCCHLTNLIMQSLYTIKTQNPECTEKSS